MCHNAHSNGCCVAMTTLNQSVIRKSMLVLTSLHINLIGFVVEIIGKS